MTACALCERRDDDDQGHPPEPGWVCCQRAHDRMLAALRDIPKLVDELAGLGFVERDVRPGTRAVRMVDGDVSRIVRVPAPAADPVAHLWPAGPAKTGWRESRISGTRPERVPVRLDDTDLTAPARHGSMFVADTSPWPDDQVGHLAVATELEFWARDWADERRERSPYPTVPVLARWLVDRLDWACARHSALVEFADKLRDLRGTLSAACGRSMPAPEAMEAPCPSCGLLGLVRDRDIERIGCGSCSVLMTEEEYAEHVRGLIAGG